MEHFNWERRDHWGAKVFTGPRRTFDGERPSFCNREEQIPAAREFERTEFRRREKNQPTHNAEDRRVVVAKWRATGNTRQKEGQKGRAKIVEA